MILLARVLHEVTWPRTLGKLTDPICKLLELIYLASCPIGILCVELIHHQVLYGNTGCWSFVCQGSQFPEGSHLKARKSIRY